MSAAPVAAPARGYLGGRVLREDREQAGAVNARLVRVMIRNRGLTEEIEAEARDRVLGTLLQQVRREA